MKTFIVDDDAVSRMVVRHSLESCPGFAFRISEFEGAQALLDVLAEDPVPPSLVCCDLRMPGMSGLELMATLRADSRHTDIPFAMITGVGDEVMLHQTFAGGALGLISKAASPVEMSIQISSIAALALARGMEPADDVQRRLRISAAQYAGEAQALLGACEAADDLDTLEAGLVRLGMHRAAALLQRVRSLPNADASTLPDCLAEVATCIRAGLPQ